MLSLSEIALLFLQYVTVRLDYYPSIHLKVISDILYIIEGYAYFIGEKLWTTNFLKRQMTLIDHILYLGV